MLLSDDVDPSVSRMDNRCFCGGDDDNGKRSLLDDGVTSEQCRVLLLLDEDEEQESEDEDEDETEGSDTIDGVDALDKAVLLLWLPV